MRAAGNRRGCTVFVIRGTCRPWSADLAILRRHPTPPAAQHAMTREGEAGCGGVMSAISPSRPLGRRAGEPAPGILGVAVALVGVARVVWLAVIGCFDGRKTGIRETSPSPKITRDAGDLSLGWIRSGGLKPTLNLTAGELVTTRGGVADQGLKHSMLHVPLRCCPVLACECAGRMSAWTGTGWRWLRLRWPGRLRRRRCGSGWRRRGWRRLTGRWTAWTG